MLNNVLLSDFLAIASRIPEPSLMKEDMIKIHFNDSKFVADQEFSGVDKIGTLHEVVLVKKWIGSKFEWVFA